MDIQLFQLINQTWQNPFFDWLMPIMRHKNTIASIYLVIASILFYKKGLNIALLIAVSAALTLGVADQISSHVIKPMVARLRPCNEPALEGQVRELVSCGSGYSFPSSHACTCFAFAAFGSLAFVRTRRKRIAPMLFAWAATVGYAQIYVGVHYPFDVLMGALVGIMTGCVGYYFFNHIREDAAL